jgi:hypothetical protein
MEFTDLKELKRLMAGSQREFEFQENHGGDMEHSVGKDMLFSLT